MALKSKKLVKKTKKHLVISSQQTKLNQIKQHVCVKHLCDCEECKEYLVKIPTKFANFSKKTLLIGAPNVGKSTLFNKITNGTASVSNIDRMTVDSNCGYIKKHRDQVMIDLPGLYNLSHPNDEELVVTNMLMKNDYSSITNIIGATSLKRDLYLTLQCAETGVLSAVIINAIDEVNCEIINFTKLSKLFGGVKFIPLSANGRFDANALTDIIAEESKCDDQFFKYSPSIENSIKKISNILPDHKHLSKRYISLMILEGNGYIHSYYQHFYEKEYKKLLPILDEVKHLNLADVIKAEKIQFINDVYNQCIIKKPNVSYLKINKEKQHRFDRFLLRKWVGIPLTIFLLALIYFIAFGPWTGYKLQQLLSESFFGQLVADQWLSPLFTHIWGANHVGTWFTGLFVDGLWTGMGAVLAFSVPIIILFTLVNIVQQVGIISRISVLLDQTFEHFGLSGRSFVNLMTGFGCNVPAIMMVRSSNSKKERIVSMLITPFISCSARAIVYSFVCTAIFGNHFGWLAMVGLMIISGLVALTIGLVFSETMFRKQKSFFFIEMTTWRKPDIFVILKNVWAQFVDFVKNATTFIVLASLLIWFLLHIGWNSSGKFNILKDEEINGSLIAYMAQGFNWALMIPFGGINNDHSWVSNTSVGWKMMASLLSAFPAKEIALSNLGLLFNSTDNFNNIIQTPHNIPIGISYLIILMFYLPCASTFVVIKREGGWKIIWINMFTGLITSYILGLSAYWITYAIIH